MTSKSNFSIFSNVGMRKIDNDTCETSDISLLCALACMTPWSSFFVFSNGPENAAEQHTDDHILRSVSCDEFGESTSQRLSNVASNRFSLVTSATAQAKR